MTIPVPLFVKDELSVHPLPLCVIVPLFVSPYVANPLTVHVPESIIIVPLLVSVPFPSWVQVSEEKLEAVAPVTVNVFPSQVETVLMEFEEVEPLYQIRLGKKGYIDHITVETEIKPALYEAGPEKVKELSKAISSRIQQIIGINVPVNILPPESITRSEGKAKRIIDER